MSSPLKPVHSSGVTLAGTLPPRQWDAVPPSLMGNHPCSATTRCVIKTMG